MISKRKKTRSFSPDGQKLGTLGHKALLENSLVCAIHPYPSLGSTVKYIMYTAISRKVVGKTVHATIPKGNMGYDQFTFPDTVAVEPTFIAFL